MKIHEKVLPERSLNLLKEVMSLEDYSDFYLAGGTALALQLGHRISIDLDFFTQQPFTIALLNQFPKSYTTNYARKNSIEIISEKTKVEFMYWAFPLTQDFVIVDTFRLIDPVDIGLMKLLAIQGRTSKKDIVDLYFIDKEIIPLEELIFLFEVHYPKESFNLYQSLKDIFNSKKIQKDPMPNMMIKIDFEEVFEKLKKEVITIIKKDILK